MEKYRAIPKGYMRVGEIAKRAGTNANTLRYYDKEGLLSPSAESEGGYRLYTDQDMVRLIQIQTMKELGFTLAEIKKYLVSLDTPDDMVAALTDHEVAIEKRMEVLAEFLETLKALKAEVKQMQTMDFKKYADILVNLQMKNENYWAVKHMDNDVLDYLRKRYENDEEGALILSKTMSHIQKKVVRLQKKGISPESEEAQKIAEAVWEMMFEITNGDEELLFKFSESIERVRGFDEERFGKYKASLNYLQIAVDTYFEKVGQKPLERVMNEKLEEQSHKEGGD